MAEDYFPFSTGSPSGADVTDAQWSEFGRALLGTGVLKGAAGTDLAVTTGGGMSVNIGIGEAWVFGHYYENTASLNKVLGAADPSLPRIDRIIIKFDLAAKTVLAAVKAGTPAASPVPPALTQTSSTWEMSLNQVRVNAAATTPSTFTDERTYASGVAPTNLASGTTLNGSTIWTQATDGTGSGLDADLLDGLNSGNGSGNIPVSNGTVNTNLNADKLDGLDSTGLVQVGAGNKAATPVQLIVWDSAALPAAGTKGRLLARITTTTLP